MEELRRGCYVGSGKPQGAGDVEEIWRRAEVLGAILGASERPDPDLSHVALLQRSHCPTMGPGRIHELSTDCLS